MDMMMTSSSKNGSNDTAAAFANQQQQPQIQEEVVVADGAALKCPRCGSGDTKFCYYNNYNTSQPRYLCKDCRRYWTHGGALRDVPVGGRCRSKNKRAPSSSSSSGPIISVQKKKKQQQQQQQQPEEPAATSSAAAAAAAAEAPQLQQDFPNVLPTLTMSPGFEMAPPVAPPLPPGARAASFLDMLSGRFLDGEGNEFYWPAPPTSTSAMDTPPSGAVVDMPVDQGASSVPDTQL